jgi:TRAP-type C4-dicarboxylate transport system permease small subunit
MAMRAWVRTCCDGLTWLTQKVVVALAAVMLLAIGWQIAMRYLLNRPPSWTEELALLCFTWSSLLMLAMGVRHAFHARMDLLVNRLPARLARTIEVLVQLGVAFFGAYLAFGGWAYVAETLTSFSAAIAYPIYLLHAAAPVCGALVSCFALERLLIGPASEGPLA